ncbi:hypothetical protein SD37_40905 [Amycolatopsis orientalis]|uniref:DUF4232 domain-containing protein n=1 Tax=Amycolatopsis orientalis TaxID=31958 RepID=A0A193CAD0_AMYOR|nr:DUF4232 domain-containing protein [Amycolatopsis orientalis]ANN21313.1 hypothetical protein SD37_40905 [Amycolatopsis orientalis]
MTMVRSKTISIGGLIAGTAGLLLLSACGSESTPVAQSSSATPSSSAADTSAAPSATSSSPAPAQQPAQGSGPAPKDDGLCKAGDVKLSVADGDAAAGTVYRKLVITNSSGHACTIQGFPGISYVTGADGHQVGEPAYRDGTKGEAVKLNNGESASADVGFVNVRNYDEAVCKPTETRGLRVYLPQETASNFVPLQGLGCAGKIPGNQLTVKTVHKGA